MIERAEFFALELMDGTIQLYSTKNGWDWEAFGEGISLTQYDEESGDVIKIKFFPWHVVKGTETTPLVEA